MTGLALRTANGLVAFLEVKVGSEVLLHKLQAVQMFLSPEDLPGQEDRGEKWLSHQNLQHVRTVSVKMSERKRGYH